MKYLFKTPEEKNKEKQQAWMVMCLLPLMLLMAMLYYAGILQSEINSIKQGNNKTTVSSKNSPTVTEDSLQSITISKYMQEQQRKFEAEELAAMNNHGSSNPVIDIPDGETDLMANSTQPKSNAIAKVQRKTPDISYKANYNPNIFWAEKTNTGSTLSYYNTKSIPASAVVYGGDPIVTATYLTIVAVRVPKGSNIENSRDVRELLALSKPHTIKINPTPGVESSPSYAYTNVPNSFLN